MRKIFSTVLVATALLLSMQANAAVPVSQPGDIQDAINNTQPGGSVEITLSNDILETATIQIYAKYSETGKKVTLNLNGHTLSNATCERMIELYKGELTIKNGTISGTKPHSFKQEGTIMGITGGSEVIRVYGVFQDMPDWSILNIEKDAEVISTMSAVCVYQFLGTKYYSFADAAFAGKVCDGVGSNPAPLADVLPAYKYNSNGDSVNAQGVVQRDVTTAGSPIALAQGENPAIDYSSQIPQYGTTITPGTKGSKTTTFNKMNYVTPKLVSKANGVVINVKGYVEGYKYGIKVNGILGVQSTHQPKINIYPSAEIVCFDGGELETDNQEGSVAVYASGQADWNIQGYVHGDVGVYVKAGNVTLNDAVVEGTGIHYDSIQGKGSGTVGASGCGIVVESNKSYGGDQKVVINGDSKVSSTGGFAIEESVTNGTPEQLTSITINGGIIESGFEGGIKITSDAFENDKVIITGGSIKGDSTVNVVSQMGDTTVSVSTLVIPGSSTINVGTEEKPVIIVTQGEPAPEETKVIDNVGKNDDAKLSSGVMTMSKDIVAGILYVTEGTKVVIASGKTLEAKKIIMGAADTIVVPYNGKLIITGNEGLYAENEDNIVLQAKGDSLATLLFKYSVVQNKQPFATVQYNPTAKQLTASAEGAHTWNRLALPFDGLTYFYTMNKNEIEKWDANWRTWFKVWDPAMASWKDPEFVEGVPVLEAFQGLALTNKSKNGDAKYEFTGKLQGAKQGTLEVKAGWNYYGNSFAATMNLDELLKQLNTKVNITAIKLWDAIQQRYVDVIYPQGTFGVITDLPAMQSFMFKSDKAADVELDYKKLIWDFNVTEE